MFAIPVPENKKVPTVLLNDTLLYPERETNQEIALFASNERRKKKEIRARTGYSLPFVTREKISGDEEELSEI